MDSTPELTNTEYWNKRESEVHSSDDVIRHMGCEEQPVASTDALHPNTDVSAMDSAYNLSRALNAFPENLTISLEGPVRELFRDKMLGNLVSENMILHCIEGVAMSINDRIDYLDCMESSVEACIDALLKEAAENGNLPDSEKTGGVNDDCELKMGLHKLMTDFCLRVRNIMMNQTLPVIEVMGLPYNVEQINNHGVVHLKKKDVDEIVNYIFA